MTGLVPSDRMEALAHGYLDAKAILVRSGFVDEIDWQESRCSADVTERELLSEAAWVVLNSGMRESVVRGLFPRIGVAFYEFRSASLIVLRASACRRKARRVFDHPAKIGAIIEFARMTDQLGMSVLMDRLRAEGPEFLCSLPFFGPATSRHLGKSLGLDIAKPDRHLSRLAKATGFTDAQGLCEALASITGDRVAVIDLVLWRYATIEPNYVRTFTAL
jgi:hypothetical protein